MFVLRVIFLHIMATITWNDTNTSKCDCDAVCDGVVEPISSADGVVAACLLFALSVPDVCFLFEVEQPNDQLWKMGPGRNGFGKSCHQLPEAPGWLAAWHLPKQWSKAESSPVQLELIPCKPNTQRAALSQSVDSGGLWVFAGNVSRLDLSSGLQYTSKLSSCWWSSTRLRDSL